MRPEESPGVADDGSAAQVIPPGQGRAAWAGPTVPEFGESPGVEDDGDGTKLIRPGAPRGSRAVGPRVPETAQPAGVHQDASATDIIPPAGAAPEVRERHVSEIDSRLARLAQESNLVNREAARVCLDALEQARDHGLDMSLAEMLVEHGLLSTEQADRLLRRAREEMAREGVVAGDSADEVHAVDAQALDLPRGFQVLEKIGQGAMGTIFKARQMPIDRVVALKILPERLASDEEFVRRFVREARAAGRLNHPNVVRAFDVGKTGDRYYFAMEFVDGRPLEALLRSRGKIPPNEALSIATQVARGLQGAWQHGLVHRDVKPENILITDDGIAKLADLGLAKQVNVPDAAHLTHDEVMIGTPHYVSPEQARGETIDIRTDIYALGATLYRMVTGALPHKGETAAAVLAAKFQERPRPANELEPAVSADLANVIDTMMAARPEDRYPDPEALLTDLELVASRHKPRLAGRSATSQLKRRAKASPLRAFAARRRRAAAQTAVVGGFAVVLALAGGALLLRRRPTGESAEGRAGGRRSRTAESTGLSPEPEHPAPGAVDPTLDTAKAARDLETEAAAFYQSVSEALEAGRYGDAVKKIEAEGKKYSGTKHYEELRKLRARAELEAEAEARRAAEAEQERRNRELVELARAKLEEEDFDAAMKLLAEARGLKEEEDEELRSLLLAAERGAYLALARKAENRGDYRAAMGHYTDALELEDDPELRRHVAKLEHRERRDGLLERGREAEKKGDYAAAIASYREALDLDKDPALEERVRHLELEMRLARAVAEAKAAESRGELATAIRHYKGALGIREDDDLRRHVEELDRRLRLEAVLDRARVAKGRAEWAQACSAYVEALELVKDKERAAVTEELDGAKNELAYARAIVKAREADDSQAWGDLRAHARAALAAKPGDAVATTMLECAFDEIGPEPVVVSSLGTEFVLVTAGEFTMGSSRGGGRDERPKRLAHTAAFYVGRHEVTNAEFEAFRPLRRSYRKPYSPDDRSPAVEITRQEAIDFCRWLSGKEGVEYRLPTEEEWEKAARGMDARVYPWGNEAPDAGAIHRCNYAPGEARDSWKKDAFEFAAPVGSYPEGASPYGCLDMAGNVWEWCAPRVRDDDEGSEEGAVLRGGSFGNDASALRCANRAVVRPEFDAPVVGFRCVREVRRPGGRKQAAERPRAPQ